MNLRLIARDYLVRARARREALRTLLAAHVHADVVREAHEVVELILKGALRFIGVEPPKRHDVEAIVGQFVDRLPGEWREAMEDLTLPTSSSVLAQSRAVQGQIGYCVSHLDSDNGCLPQENDVADLESRDASGARGCR